MIIAIRKETSGSIYMDKEIYSRTQEVYDENNNVIGVQPLFDDETLSEPPYNYTKVEIDDKYADCFGVDFNEDLTFNVEKYNARKQEENEVEYENKIIDKIRQKYSINQELAIQRKRYAEPEKFEEYNAYVEKCIAEVKAETAFK
jgi:hypothetical protein